LCAVERLENGDEEGECFAAACLRCAENVFPLQGKWDGGSLNIGEDFEVGGAQAGGGRFAEGKIGEF